MEGAKSDMLELESGTRQAGRVLYVGPTIRGVAIRNAVYTGIPEEAQRLQESLPLFPNLFIPIASYSRAMKMLRGHKGAIYAAYLEAARHYGNKQ